MDRILNAKDEVLLLQTPLKWKAFQDTIRVYNGLQ